MHEATFQSFESILECDLHQFCRFGSFVGE